MLRWICNKTRIDNIRNENIQHVAKVALIEDKIKENHLNWFGHLRRKPIDAPVKRMKKN